MGWSDRVGQANTWRLGSSALYRDLLEGSPIRDGDRCSLNAHQEGFEARESPGGPSDCRATGRWFGKRPKAPRLCRRTDSLQSTANLADSGVDGPEIHLVQHFDLISNPHHAFDQDGAVDSSLTFVGLGDIAENCGVARRR